MEEEVLLEAPGVNETISIRHKREQKELQSRITALKHGINKNDKKRKKEIAATIDQLTEDLKNKQEAELAELAQTCSLTIDNNGGQSNSEDVADFDAKDNLENGDSVEAQDSQGPPKGKISKAQKRREKKEAEERARNQAAVDDEVSSASGKRNMEFESIRSLLRQRALQIHDISADGDCLFNAIRHQLAVKSGQTQSVTALRTLTANYMRQNTDDFLPFFAAEHSDDSATVSLPQFQTYCNKAEKSGIWGGQLEIRAMAYALKMPIEVVQHPGTCDVVGEEFRQNPSLVITYHRHAFRLGEHYNSTEPSHETSNDNF